MLGKELSFADGKMFYREKVPPEIPYQRALIMYDEGVETLVLQSQYAYAETNAVSEIGWVVPAPVGVEVASIPADYASHLFRNLSRLTRPKVRDISSELYTAIIILIFAVSVGALVVYLGSFLKSFGQNRFVDYRKTAGQLFLVTLFIVIASGVMLPSLASSRGAIVDVVDKMQVGAYEVQVIRSEDSSAVIAWLNENDFNFGDRDTDVFGAYIERGWDFVVARISEDLSQSEDGQIVSEGLAAPLILRFEHPQPVYPMALTGTGGFDTEVLLYLYSKEKWGCEDQMTLRFAGEREGAVGADFFFFECDPEDFFDEEDFDFNYLCKFKDTQTPEQMKSDLIFTPAPDNEFYREEIVQW